MPRFASYRGAVKRVLQDLHLIQAQRIDITPTVTEAPALQNTDGVDRELIEEAIVQNRSLPINRLPNELLIRIFLLVDPTQREGRESLAWMKLTLVCRYWRDVTLATPSLWRSIDAGQNPHWTDLALTRSDPATLDIRMPQKYLSQEIFSLINPHVHRIRSLFFSDSNDVQWFSILRDLLDRQMPALEALTLSVKCNQTPWPWPDQSPFFDIQISSQQCPGLQLLSLSHMTMPRDPLLFSKLHTLDLDDCECDCSIDQFLDIISSCSMLRKLLLSSFLHRLTGNWPNPPIPERTLISLPRIATVVLQGHLPHHSSYFLAHLILPANIRLIVQASVPVRGPNSNSSLSEAIPHRTTVLPLLRTITTVELYIEHRLDRYHFQGSTRKSGAEYPFQLQYRPLLEDPVDRGPAGHDLQLRALADLVTVFQSSSLRNLSLQGLSVALAQAKWREVLDAFPRLKVLRVNDDGPMVALVGALQSESSSIPRSESEHDAGGDGSLVPCPRLRFLSLELACDMYGPLLDMVLDCLRRRAEKGSRLSKLQLQSYSTMDAIAEDWTAFVQGLEGVVQDVSYVRRPEMDEVLNMIFGPTVDVYH